MSIALPAIPSPYIHSSQKRRKNVWYSIKDGNWTDPNTWMSNSLSFAQWNFNYPGQSVPSPIFPAVGDDVYINHRVTLNIGTTQVPVVVNSLYISGTLNAILTRAIRVNGDIQVVGTIDFTGNSSFIYLYGTNNYINSLIYGTSTVSFLQVLTQPIINCNYYNLTSSPTDRYLISNLLVNGTLTISGGVTKVFELSIYDLTVYLTTTVHMRLSKTGSGNILFMGQLDCGYGDSGVNFTGNPTIEFRGGALLANNQGYNNFGTGLISFTTNNQHIDLYSTTTFTDVIIYSGIILTVAQNGNSPMSILNSINGASSTSKLVNSGWIRFYCTTWMTTGIFDYLTNSNIVGFMMDGDFTIPYTLMWSMEIGGTGTKYLSGDTVLQGDLIATSGFLDFANYNLTVDGASDIGGNISNCGASNIFIGLLTCNTTSFGTSNVECRGGINFGASFTANVLSFTTNNQNADSTDANVGMNSLINAQVLIQGAITIAFGNHLPASSGATFLFQLNGDNVSSTFLNKVNGSINGSLYGVHYQSTLQPMAIGILDCNSFDNIWIYDLSGNQDIKGTTYRTLIFGGSGVKKLMGNVIINTTSGGSWSITGTATINYNGFTITTI